VIGDGDRASGTCDRVSFYRRVVSLLIAGSVSACSFATMRGPSPDAGPAHAASVAAPAPCQGGAPIAVDGVLAVLAIGATVAAAVVAALPDVEDGEQLMIAPAATAALFTASAIYGGTVRRRCRAAAAEWRRQHSPDRPMALDAGLTRTTLVPIQSELAACSDGEDITSAIRATVTVAASGAVSTIDIASDVPDGRAPCIEAVLRAARFPPTQLGGNFVYQARGPRP
jgi:hypothetical protein